MNKKHWLVLLGFLVLSGCAVIATNNFKDLYGDAHPRERVVANLPNGSIDYWADVKPILNDRCVVCHGCYDAPCQLKLTAIEGLERGANKANVYHATRLRAANLTRLFEDADTVSGWRDIGFFPVLNEYEQSPEANKQAGLMYQMLDLKARHPLPEQKILDKSFTLGLNRKESCPIPEVFSKYAVKTPLWGMPYGLPLLESKEQKILIDWLAQGARYTKRKPLPVAFHAPIVQWEARLNGNSLKERLISRYIYEHLFLGHIYFNDVSESTFFKLIRSSTPPGQDVQPIVTRRPYDDPGVERIFYRFVPELETIVTKSHMPYALNATRMKRWNSLFFNEPFDVKTLPTYGTKQAANPFDSFEQLPMTSRYKFMLDEAQFTIMNYIKGPVCRGNVALDVIRDQFWVFFINPELSLNDDISSSLVSNKDTLALPNSVGKTYLPIGPWVAYAKNERANRKRGDELAFEIFKDGTTPLNLDLIWDGTDGQGGARNKNAALTIFRHYDTASVEQGLIGNDPQTAWVISYPLLERIYYLLVAGYDVYGNVSHQLLSRLHMDFLRMDGEVSFLMLLPQHARDSERENWYRGANKRTMEHLTNAKFEVHFQPNIEYKTNNPKKELYAMLKKHLGSALPKRYSLEGINNKVLRNELKRLETFSGVDTNIIAEMSLIEIIDEQGKSSLITLIRNNAHLRITSLMREKRELIPVENTVTVVKGTLGAYPNVFMRVQSADIKDFVNQVLALQSEDDYSNLLDRFGVRRTNQGFWQHSDAVHAALRLENTVEYGMLDYNRLENR